MSRKQPQEKPLGIIKPPPSPSPPPIIKNGISYGFITCVEFEEKLIQMIKELSREYR